MKNLISLSEILGTVDDGGVELCATAEAYYDTAAEKVSVTLDAFARHAWAAREGERLPERWLPQPERVGEHLPQDEADAFTRDVFASWVKKVRAAVPVDRSLHV